MAARSTPTEVCVMIMPTRTTVPRGRKPHVSPNANCTSTINAVSQWSQRVSTL
nr:hypothetical protein [Novacetimonas hansenii]